MNALLTQAANPGHRNSSLLGAFALVLAFAFGVGSTTAPAFAAGQQLVPADISLPLLADLDTPFDFALPVTAPVFTACCGKQHAPQAGRVLQPATVSPAAFLARAPPL